MCFFAFFIFVVCVTGNSDFCEKNACTAFEELRKEIRVFQNAVDISKKELRKLDRRMRSLEQPGMYSIVTFF